MEHDIGCKICHAKVASVTLPEGEAYKGDAYYAMFCEKCAKILEA